MKKITSYFLFASLFIMSFSCKQADNSNKTTQTPAKQEVKKVANVITKEQQAAMSPDMVIQSLKDGNQRYVNNDLTQRDHSQQIIKSTKGQHPKAIVLSCVDSRVPVEDVFDKGIGDLFVARVAGNFVNEDILGSMEYACKVVSSKLILVLGHEHCGAVKATIDDVKLGNITPMLAKIKPALKNTKYDGDRSTKNPAFVHKVCENNVLNTINEIRKQSPILAEMEKKGEIKIVGGIYDLDNGKVNFL